MQKTMVEEFISTPEGMAQFQQERAILDVAILVRRLLKQQGLTKADLAQRLGKSKAFITQLLDGRANMTIRTISDVMCALGQALVVSSEPLTRAVEHGVAMETVAVPAGDQVCLSLKHSNAELIGQYTFTIEKGSLSPVLGPAASLPTPRVAV